MVRGRSVTELPTILNTIEPRRQRWPPEVYGITAMTGAPACIDAKNRSAIADRSEVPHRNKIPEDAKFGEAHLVGLPVGAITTAPVGHGQTSRRLRIDPTPRLALPVPEPL